MYKKHADVDPAPERGLWARDQAWLKHSGNVDHSMVVVTTKDNCRALRPLLPVLQILTQTGAVRFPVKPLHLCRPDQEQWKSIIKFIRECLEPDSCVGTEMKKLLGTI